MSTYHQEVLELKKEILTEISNEFKHIANYKIKISDLLGKPIYML